MSQISVCPADRVNAPAGRIWALLSQPRRYGDFWDLTVESVHPPGPAVPGQRVDAWSRAFGKRWTIRGEVIEASESEHVIRFRMTLPFGVVSDNRISWTPIDDRSCLVRFG